VRSLQWYNPKKAFDGCRNCLFSGEYLVNLTVFVEQIDPKKFRAETSQPFALSTEGSSREEAIERMRELAQERLAAGEMVQIEVPGSVESSSWSRFAGIWKDHPDMEEYRRSIAEYRRRVDEEQS
jgi:hypothetical protein